MIYLFVALHMEAKGLIGQLHLKKQNYGTGYDVFENEDFRLILTDSGILAATAAVSRSLTFFHAGSGDMMVNFGGCASETPGGGVFRLCQLTEKGSGKTFYPDLLFRSGFSDARIITETCPWQEADRENRQKGEMPGDIRQVGLPVLHDMEAAAVYFAGSYFFAPHQMHFIKVVTDHGEKHVSKTRYMECIELALPDVLGYLRRLLAVQEEEKGKGRFSPDLEKIFCEFRCSQAMKISFAQCIRYWVLTGTDYERKLREMREAGMLPCKNRQEGKKRFEQLKQELF